MHDILYHSFSPVEIMLLGGLAVACVWEVYFYVRYMLGFWRLKRREKHQRIEYLAEKPGVSVVICARDESQNLRVYLPHILEQDYPEFEVIVVDDASTDETTDVLNIYRQRYPNLHVTFVPRNAHMHSSRKLAITLGIKAAKHNLILLTSANCCPESRLWIDYMVRNFVPGVDFVIGYNALFDRSGLLNRIVNYDDLTGALKYMGAALEGKPYMGDGSNMAYRKDFFMEHRGFAEILGTRWGEDSLYVNRYATGKNVRVESSPESVMWSRAPRRWSDWIAQRVRQLAPVSQFSGRSFLWLMFEPVGRIFFYALVCAAIVVGIMNQNWLCVGIAVVLYLIRILGLICIVGKAARRYGKHLYGIRVMLFDVFLPMLTTWLYIFRTGSAQRREFY